MSDRYVVEERPCVSVMGKKQGHDLPKPDSITRICFQVIDTLTNANAGENYELREEAEALCEYRNQIARGIPK